MRRSIFNQISLVLLAGAICAGCGGSSTSGGSAKVRAVNAMPDLASATLNVGVTIVQSEGAYGSATGFESVKGGDAQSVTLLDGAGGVLVDTTASISSGFYTAYEVGSTDAPELVIDHEDHSAPASGTARLNLVNVAPSAASVDVYVTATDATLDTATPKLSGLAFRSTAAVTVATGTYRVRFTTHGTKTVVADLNPVTLSNGNLSRLVLLDASGGGSPLQVITLTDSD